MNALKMLALAAVAAVASSFTSIANAGSLCEPGTYISLQSLTADGLVETGGIMIASNGEACNLANGITWEANNGPVGDTGFVFTDQLGNEVVMTQQRGWFGSETPDGRIVVPASANWSTALGKLRCEEYFSS